MTDLLEASLTRFTVLVNDMISSSLLQQFLILQCTIPALQFQKLIYRHKLLQVNFLSASDSHYTKLRLSTHPNIHIVRHPDQKIPTFWAHHEKLVVVDRRIGFLGEMCNLLKSIIMTLFMDQFEDRIDITIACISL